MGNVLILGGTYFLGKHSVSELEKNGHFLTLANRQNAGNVFSSFPNIRQVFWDREDPETYQNLPEENYDAVIDFCGYHPGDVRQFHRLFSGNVSKYIFISTVDVYERKPEQIYRENDPVVTKNAGGEVGDYIYGKAVLEQEVKEYYDNWTILRPSMIFGPDNYAPRESLYFTMIKTRGRIISPADSDSFWQMVYVKDVARAVRMAAENFKFRQKTINITSEEQFTYSNYEELLGTVCGVSFEKIPVPVSDVITHNLPIPFPLTKSESAFYDNRLSTEMGIVYTNTLEAMKETYQSFWEDFEKDSGSNS